jgi:hypothetical protein
MNAPILLKTGAVGRKKIGNVSAHCQGLERLGKILDVKLPVVGLFAITD